MVEKFNFLEVFEWSKYSTFCKLTSLVQMIIFLGRTRRFNNLHLKQNKLQVLKMQIHPPVTRLSCCYHPQHEKEDNPHQKKHRYPQGHKMKENLLVMMTAQSCGPLDENEGNLLNLWRNDKVEHPQFLRNLKSQ